MNIVNIDHIVLTVKNIADTVRFYESVLGMKKETYGEGRIALKFGNQKINLHDYVKSKGIKILAGPVTRTGATGAIKYFYFRDPDGNLIEVANLSNDS
jgi:catechol 2,3-dioxygenase-like lactoylglutathione lyase family enzyme